MTDDSPEARVARWTERDAAIGAHAEVEQLRAILAERDREVANLRERATQLAHNVTSLQLERNRLDALLAQVPPPPPPPPPPSVARRVRSFAGRILRRLGLRR